MRYLGIDFGTKRVGVAISDEENHMAFPLTTILNDSRLIDTCGKLIAEHKITDLVVGESKNLAGLDNKIMPEIRVFAEAVRAANSVRVIFEPEFLTSVQAAHLQGETKTIDASAAAIILQSYLDRNRK